MTTPNNTKALTVSEYMRKPESIARFSEVLGDKNAAPYIQSVLIAVSSSEQLMKCTPQSIMRSALRAASLGLSCDPALKQAWLVPYNKKNKDGTWSTEAQFQPHYKGLYTLAMRTGKYWTINVSPVYEGQRVLENPLTGLHLVQDGSQVGMPQSYNGAYQDVTTRRKKELRVIGWIGYLKTKKGAEKSVWMSSAEIDDHASKYVKDYDKNPNWNDAEKRPVMEMKTVLRQLLSWADLSGNESADLIEAMNAEEPAEEPITVTPSDAPSDIHEMTEQEARETIAQTPKGERFMGEMSADELNAVYLSEGSSDAQKRAAAMVLKSDYSMDAPEQPKKAQQQNMKELGF